MHIQTILEQVGFTTKEASIYLKLLELGSQPIGVISKKTNINRTTCYKVIEDLIRKGLLTSYKKSTGTYITAESPHSIIKYLQTKENKYNHLKKFISQNIETLNKIQNESFIKPSVKFYQGIQGVIQTYEDTISEGKTIYAIESTSKMSKEIKEYLYNTYIPKRINNKIFAKAIMPNIETNSKLKNNDNKHYRETKLINGDFLDFTLEINIYGNKVAFIILEHNKHMSIVIENQDIAQSLKALFNLLWSTIK